MNSHLYIESPADGLALNTLIICSQEDPKAAILFIHGLCGKIGRMLPTMSHFAAEGYACIGFDMRGHGDSIKTEEDRGYTYQGGSEAMVEDIRAVIGWIEENFPTTPIFIVAHSMGSLAARTYIKSDDTHIDGLVLSGSPSFNPLSPYARIFLQAYNEITGGHDRLEALQRFTSDLYNKDFEDDGFQAWMCSDPEERQRFFDDPECNYTCTTDCSLTLLMLMKETYSRKGWHVANPSLPILFISGENDSCMISMKKFHQSAGFLNSVGYTDVSSIIFPDMRHEVLNEIGKESAWQAISEFISRERQDG
ncbi:MAG: alpha/beta fold hydrolase [Bacteroidales bacterium]|nr:alpha/beta fold hydrolase [Bacteroidales bacterium]